MRAPNNCLQAIPEGALGESLRFESGAPEAGRSPQPTSIAIQKRLLPVSIH